MMQIHRSSEDLISNLPDTLLCQILSHLPTKTTVSCSILSTKWRFLHLSIPILDLNFADFSDYNHLVNFITHFLDFSTKNSSSYIHKFRLIFKRQEQDSSPITSWINTIVLNKIQHLDLDCYTSFAIDKMPLSLYMSSTLVCLKLRHVALDYSEFMSLPLLKILHLEENLYTNDNILETLISSCPVLEELKVVRNVDETVKVLRVCSKTLQSLVLDLDSSKAWFNDDSFDWKVVIDAPELTYFSLYDDQSASFTLYNLGKSIKVDLGVTFNIVDMWEIDSVERSWVDELLIGLSNVRDLSIKWRTFKIIIHFWEQDSLHKFPYMTRLDTNFCVSEMAKMFDFLGRCPNLESLVLKVKGVADMKEMSILCVPSCLKLTIEYVEIRNPINGNEVEMKVIKYFLENCLVLKKFTLRLGCVTKEEETSIVMEVLKFHRSSRACEVNVVGLEERLMIL